MWKIFILKGGKQEVMRVVPLCKMAEKHESVLTLLKQASHWITIIYDNSLSGL